MLLQGFHPCERLIELRVVAQGLAVVRLRLAVVGGVHQREIVALLDGLTDLGDDLLHLPSHGEKTRSV